MEETDLRGSRNAKRTLRTLVGTLALSAVLGGLLVRGSDPQKPVSEVTTSGIVIELNSEQGRTYLQNNRYAADYWLLTQHYAAQANLTYCGVATAAMVLNSLPVVKEPIESPYGSYQYYTQQNVFTEKVQGIIRPDQVASDGITLDQLAKVLGAFPTTVDVRHAENSTLDEFRSEAQANLLDPTNFLIVNYDRSILGQPGGGHISPVAAYHSGSDRFLILDVAPYKAPFVWVRAGDLWQAMLSIDKSTGRSRGFVFVEPRDPSRSQRTGTSTSDAASPR
jgi:hypothetical protein